MPNILIAWELGTGPGHLRPLRPIIDDLLARDCKVTVVARELSHIHLSLPDPRITFIQAPLSRGDSAFEQQTMTTFAHILATFGFGNKHELRATATAWHTIYDFVSPDVVVAEHAPTALLAARRSNINCAVIGNGFFLPPNVTPFAQLMPWRPADPASSMSDERAVLRNTNLVLDLWGCEKLHNVSQLYHDASQHFLTTIRELDPYSRSSETKYYGVPQDSDGLSPDWPSGSGPRIFAYLKVYPTLPKILDTLSYIKHPTIVYVPEISPSLVSHYESTTLQFAKGPLSVATVCRECSLLVHNAGHGLTIQALLAGKPSLLIPFYAEHAVHAAAVDRMHAGVIISSPDSAHEIAVKLIMLVQNLNEFSKGAEAVAKRYIDSSWRDNVRVIADELFRLAT
jgi:hypothetical protein